MELMSPAMKRGRVVKATLFGAYVMLILLAVTAIILGSNVAKASQHPGQTGEVLEQGGGYISNATIESLRDGLEPWDADSTPGNDSSQTNHIVRTFDTVRYEVKYVISLRENSQYDYYKNTRVGFRVALPVTNKQATFDTDAMGWVDTTSGYETNIANETIGSQQWQVLTCYRRLISTSEVPTVAPGTATVFFPITVKGMKNGDVLTPQIHVWIANDGSNNQTNYGNPYGKECTVDPVTVSAAPRYNIRFANSYEVSAKGMFDFSTGNEYAQNKTVGRIEGRLFAYGLTLQLYNTNAAKRLKGVEFPNGSPITFDVSLKSVFGYMGTNGQHADADVTNTYTPLVWACDGESDTNPKSDGRSVLICGNTSAAVRGDATVFNKRGSEPNAWTYSAYDGGTWRVTQSGNILHFTVSDYHMDPDNFPHKWSSVDSSNQYPLYNPETGIQNIGCFSGCGLWIIQPIENLSTHQSPFEQYPVANGDGTFTITAEDYKLRATSVSGQSLAVVDNNTNQGNIEDDKLVLTKAIRQPGKYDTRCQYTYHDNENAIEKGTDRLNYKFNYSDGTDAATLGSKLRILCGFRASPLDMENQSVLSLTFVRFDDKIVSYDSSRAFCTALDGVMTKVRPYFVAKTNHKGWDNDDEMKTTTYNTEGLIFFDNYDTLISEGYTCVGVLLESRWAYTDGPMMYADLYYTIPIAVTSDEAQIGNVAMCTNEVAIWTRRTLAEGASAQLSKPIAELTREDYQRYADAVFHTVNSNRQFVGFSTDPTWYVNRGPEYTQKAYYDENGYAGGHEGAYQLGDSLLVLGEVATVAKSVSQQSNNEAKKIYDMGYQQRYADYVITLNVADTLGHASTAPTTLTVVDTLPSSLSYLPNSAFYGGTYTEHTPLAGEVTGGETLIPTVTKNSDGTTTLKFVLPDVVPTELQPIRFSTQIGKPGNEDEDVQNNQSIVNEVTVTSTLDKRAHKEEYGNKSLYTISVAKLHQQSLTIYADPLYNEQNSTLTMYSTIGNYGGTNLANALGINIMPWMGTGTGSNYHGTYTISGAELDLSKVSSPGDVTIWFTNDTSYRTASHNTMTWDDVHTHWTQGTINLTTGAITIPNGFSSPTAWAIHHPNLPDAKSLRVTMRILPNGNSAGDDYQFVLTDTDNTVQSSVYVVTRIISGVVWRDNDGDGVRQANKDDLLSNVEVSLVSDETGNVITNHDGNACKMTTSADGYYSFQKLPSGNYHVKFRLLTTGGWKAYTPTVKNAPKASEPNDSDADGIFEADVLKELSIGTLQMQAIEDMATNVQAITYQDAGVKYIGKPLQLHKMDYDDHSLPVSNATFVLSGTTVSGEQFEHTLVSTATGDLEMTTLPYGNYTLTETIPKEGYAPATSPWSIAVNSNGVTLSGDAELTIAAENIILNKSAYHLNTDMPLTGRRELGIILAIATTLAIAGGLSWIFSIRDIQLFPHHKH